MNLWAISKNLYGRFMGDECIVVSLASSPRHLIKGLVGFVSEKTFRDRGPSFIIEWERLCRC